MAALRSLRVTLQDEFKAEDTKWAYTIKNLPTPKTLVASNLLKSISFVSSKAKQQAVLRLETPPSNRITRNEPLHRLLLLSFDDFRLRLPPSPTDPEIQLATARDSAVYIAKLLKTGIVINGIQYHFFGHSNSQLKSRSCYMYAGSQEEVAKKVEELGDFSKLKTVGKKAKRIGLLFSSADVAFDLDPQRCEDIDDIVRDDYTFTDGCGLIARQLARSIAQRRHIVFRNRRYLPSVFQIRYRGYKGVLTLSPALKGKTQVQFRHSMRKFKEVKDLSFSVVDYSKVRTVSTLRT